MSAEVPLPLTPEQLENWFTYHPPTDEQKARYAAIKKAYDVVHDRLVVLSVGYTGPVVKLTYDTVNAECRALVEAIDANAPDSADKTAAIRCVRLVRNAINEGLSHGDHTRFLLELAHADLIRAKWQANSAIACGGR